MTAQTHHAHHVVSYSARLAMPCDPLEVVVQLARSGLVREYAVYEQAGCWTFAGGVLGSVTVDPQAIRTRWEGTAGESTDHSAPLGDTHPAKAVGEALRGFPAGDWQAFGWIAFESALDAAARSHVAPGDLLAYMFVPRFEARIGPDGVEARCADTGLLNRVLTELRSAGQPAGRPAARPVDVETGYAEAYQRAVSSAVRRIARGELEKVILSRAVEVPFPLDFPATYLAGRRANTPARSFLLDLPGVRAAGFSPETVAEVSLQGWATTQPLAGTRARHGERGADQRSQAELATDPKEVYEHAVSVKLADTELRNVCTPDTVAVSEFMVLKERGSVHHLGSRVHGRLRDDRNAWDALAALFPSVTASGIPKARAYDVITELEPKSRGLYSGAVVRATSDGELDAALVLRTVYTHGGRTWLRAGAGIVAASRPEREYRETCEKLASVAPYLVPLPGA